MHLASKVIQLRSMLLLPLILTALTAATSTEASQCLPETRVRDFFSSTPENRQGKPDLTHRKHRGKKRFSAGLASERSSFHKDHLGSTTVVTDTFGNPDQDLTQYRPFGLQRAGSSLSGKTDYGFTDQEFDKTTGFYNYDARLYNPEIGMFNSPDSVIPDVYDPQMLNPYTYTRNNPIKYIDPDGLQPTSPAETLMIVEVISTATAVAGAMVTAGVALAAAGVAAVYTAITSGGTVEAPSGRYPFRDHNIMPNIAEHLKPQQQMAASSKGDAVSTGKKTSDPTARAGKKIAEEGGVKVKSYGTADAHKPAHAHVKGGGSEVRVGPNTKPLKGEPELSPKQRKVVEKHKKAIRKELKKVGKARRKSEEKARKDSNSYFEQTTERQKIQGQ